MRRGVSDTKTMGGIMVWSHEVIATVYISVSRLLKKVKLNRDPIL